MIYLDELVRATTANLVSAGARASFPAFAHDSRQVAPGECFVAVRGSHADGHEYLEDARAAGAGAVLIEVRRQAVLAQGQSSVLERLAEAGVAGLCVEDTPLAGPPVAPPCPANG